MLDKILPPAASIITFSVEIVLNTQALQHYLDFEAAHNVTEQTLASYFVLEKMSFQYQFFVIILYQLILFRRLSGVFQRKFV